MPKWFPGPLEDILKGVGKVHRGMSEVEGARKVAPEVAEAQKKMTPLQILEDYNQRQMFGKTKQGEPIRAATRVPTSQNPRALSKGYMPKNVGIQLYPESEFLGENVVRPSATPLGGMELAAHKPDLEMFPMLEGMIEDFMHAPRRSSRALDELPVVYEIDSTAAAPGTGAMQYQMVYDMLRAQDDVNRASALSDINKLRRLGNAMSFGLRHGDYRNVAPVSEITKGQGKSVSPQLFGKSSWGAPNQGELDWLQGMLPKELRTQYGELRPIDVISLSPEEITGLLAVREAQLAGTYGPLYPRARQAVDDRRRAISDLPELRNIAEPAASIHRGSEYGSMNMEAGIGPHTLGRQLTTEEVLTRMNRGEDPESILQDILRVTNPEGLKGRYADGGAVVAY